MNRMILWSAWSVLIAAVVYYYGLILPFLISADSDLMVAAGFISFLPATYAFVTGAKNLLAEFNKEDDKKFDDNTETNKE